MKRHFVTLLIALLVVSSVAATGVLIRTGSKAAGFNDAAFYAYQGGKNNAAEQLYQAALAENPEYEVARYNLATLYFQERKYDAAIAQLELLVAQRPQEPHYHYDLAVNLIENIRENHVGLDLFDRALFEYKQADALSPGFEHVQENIAVLERIKAESTA